MVPILQAGLGFLCRGCHRPLELDWLPSGSWLPCTRILAEDRMICHGRTQLLRSPHIPHDRGDESGRVGPLNSPT